MLAIGDVLNGRYRLDRLIGQGGFARVFLGIDLFLKRQVAIKVLNPELTGDRTFLARFEEEAQRVAALDHPHVLPVYDYGRVADTAYLVMPYVAGGTLQHKLNDEGRLLSQETSGYLRQAGAALDYAHGRNIVHCDVKPLNMLLRDDGHLFLADFGIAKVLQDSRVLNSSRVVGTIAYMAPEQFQGQASPASDVYALGCVLFQLLTGEPPYTGSVQQVMFGHIAAPVPSVVERSQGQASPAVQSVIARALAKQPQSRFRSAGEFAREYEVALTDHTGKRLGRRALVAGGVVLGLSAMTLGGIFVERDSGGQIATGVMSNGGTSGGASVAVTEPARASSQPTSTATLPPTVTSVPPTAAPTAQPTATLTPMPSTATPILTPGTVLYQADWSRGLGDWRGSGEWATVRGMLVNAGNQTSTYLGTSFIPAPARVATADYAVEIEMQILVPGSGYWGESGAGVFVRQSERGRYIGGFYYPCNSISGCTKAAIIGDREVNKAIREARFNVGENWHKYRLEAEGNTIRLLIDGGVTLEAADNRYLSGDQVGLWCSNSQINVRSFRVIAL